MKSLHYWFLVSCVIKGVKSSLRFISNLFCLIGRNIALHPSYFFLVLLENTKFTKNTNNLPRIPGTHMKSLHYWFLVVTYFHIRPIGRKIAIRIPSLPRRPRIYQEYQEHTWNRFIISHFFHFNLMSSLPIFIDENTKHFLHLIGRKNASYLFSLYFGTNLLHFPFFPL